MSAESIENSRSPISPTPRELAATLFRRPRLVAASFGLVLLATIFFFVFSARYESHFKVLLRRGRVDPIVPPQPATPVDFPRPGITEEEITAVAELLRAVTRKSAAAVRRSRCGVPPDRQGSGRDRAPDFVAARTAEVVSLPVGHPQALGR